MKKQRKYLAVILTLSLGIFPIMTNINSTITNAKENDNNIKTEVDSNKKYNHTKKTNIEINGNSYELEVNYDFPLEKPTGLFPEYPIGTKRHVRIKISKTELVAFGGVLSVFVPQSTVISAISRALPKVAPWIIKYARFSKLIGPGLILIGPNGLTVDFDAEYISHYYHMGGYDVYVWSIYNFRLGRY